MTRAIWLGAVAYDPKVVTIWEGMRRYFHEEARLAVEVVLFQSYEAQVGALLAAPSAPVPRIDDLVDHLERPRDTTMLRVLETKAAAGDIAINVTSAAMRICGGAAFSKHLNIERLFRDAHAGAVMAPTGDVLRDFIAKAVLGIPLF